MKNTEIPVMYTRINEAQNGNSSVMNDLVKENSGLIWSIVKRFAGRNAEAEDLYQIGAIGLIKAIKNFNTDFNVCFSTYAVPMIMGEIKRFLRDDGMIKVSRTIKENAIKIHSVKERLEKQLLREPTVSEISNETGLSSEDIIEAMECSVLPESLDAAVSGDNDTAKIDMISKSDGFSAVVTNKVMLVEIINSFSEKEKKIIILRYFKEKTQADIAELLGISQVQVSRLEKKILAKMKEKIIL